MQNFPSPQFLWEVMSLRLAYQASRHWYPESSVLVVSKLGDTVEEASGEILIDPKG